jgi:deglycase
MSLSGKRVAMLAENLFEDLELWYPVIRLREAGATVVIVGSGSSEVYKGKRGLEVKVDTSADKVEATAFDAVIVPGGYCPDYLRRYPSVLKLVKDAHERGKVVAAICHAGWVLVSAGILRGRTVTSFKSIKDDVVNAGANYVDREVVRDGNLITSRFPDDLPAFCREIIAALEEVKVAPIKGRAR